MGEDNGFVMKVSLDASGVRRDIERIRKELLGKPVEIPVRAQEAYLIDVDDYSEGMALQIMSDCEPIEISNKELQSQFGHQNAYNYALK